MEAQQREAVREGADVICAICTDEIPGIPKREPLGRDGGMVAVCDGCSNDHPRTGRYWFEGCESSNRSMGPGNRHVSNRRGRVR